MSHSYTYDFAMVFCHRWSILGQWTAPAYLLEAVRSTGFSAQYLDYNIRLFSESSTPELWNENAYHQFWITQPLNHLIDKIDLKEIDAASEETYKIVRRGGDWQLLQDNLKFISTLRERGLVDNIYFKYVVQDINFREMPQFVELSKSMNASSWFIRIASQAHISGDEFAKRAIFHNEHPMHEEFLETLRHPIFQDTDTHMGNLTDIFEKANNMQ